MINRAKLTKELLSISDQLFYNNTAELSQALEVWNNLKLTEYFYINYETIDYLIIGVDGSQIYPDRHQATNCFLINIGSVIMKYGTNSFAKFDSEPKTYLAQNNNIDEFNFNDYVDALREELEYQKGLEISLSYKTESLENILLFDGSLIFWNLVSKSEQFKEHFLKKYLDIFSGLHNSKIMYGSYTSLPKNRELINLIKEHNSNLKLDYLTDIDLMQKALPVFHRTKFFKSEAEICNAYPKLLKPHFCYINVGPEIARLEIPEFIVENNELLKSICNKVLDQALKGLGYPIVLAEAHEQAVVKSFDRDFFYDFISKMGYKKNIFIAKSQKSQKKLKMAV